MEKMCLQVGHVNSWDLSWDLNSAHEQSPRGEKKSQCFRMRKNVEKTVL